MGFEKTSISLSNDSEKESVVDLAINNDSKKESSIDSSNNNHDSNKESSSFDLTNKFNEILTEMDLSAGVSVSNNSSSLNPMEEIISNDSTVLEEYIPKDESLAIDKN